MEVSENVANKMSIESISGRLMKIADGRKTLVEWCAPERIGWRKVIIKTTFMILMTMTSNEWCNGRVLDLLSRLR